MCSIIGFSSHEVSPDCVRTHFGLSVSRGPDQTRFVNAGNNNYLGFNRLAIMDLSEECMYLAPGNPCESEFEKLNI